MRKINNTKKSINYIGWIINNIKKFIVYIWSMINNNSKSIAYIIGVIIFYISAKIVIEKAREAILNEESVREISMLFDANELIKILVLCGLFLLLIYVIPFKEKSFKKILNDSKKFLNWGIYISISAMLISVLLLVSDFREEFNVLIFLVFFSLFVLSEKLKK